MTFSERPCNDSSFRKVFCTVTILLYAAAGKREPHASSFQTNIEYNGPSKDTGTCYITTNLLDTCFLKLTFNHQN